MMRLFVSQLLPVKNCTTQTLSCGDCLEGKRGDYLNTSVLLCFVIVHRVNQLTPFHLENSS